MNWNPKARRRWFGVLCLLAAMLMLAAGETWLDEHLAGLRFVAYWFICFCFTMLAIVAAMLDARASRREIRREHDDLLKSALSEIETQKPARPRDNLR